MDWLRLRELPVRSSSGDLIEILSACIGVCLRRCIVVTLIVGLIEVFELPLLSIFSRQLGFAWRSLARCTSRSFSSGTLLGSVLLGFYNGED